MFSSRLDWDLRPNRIAAALAARTSPILDLTESNPTRAGFDYPAGIVSCLAEDRSLLYEPAPTGLLAAREAVAAAYAARGVAVHPDDIVLTPGSSEAYAWLFKLLANPGDEILVPRPSYPLFEYLAALDSVRVVSYPLAYHGSWSLEMHELARAASPRARAVVVVNPNNPTGSFIKRAERDALAAFCAARDLAIISDEVFSNFTFGPDPLRVPAMSGAEGALVFALGGLSKMAGLPQMKLGWIAVSGPNGLRRAALERLELIADTYLSVGTPVQHAAARLLEFGDAIRSQIAARVRRNYDRLRELAAGACELLNVEGGWYATLRVPRTRTEEEWVLELLERDGVLVQPGYFYDFEAEAYLVLSLLPQPAVFDEGAARVTERCGRF